MRVRAALSLAVVLVAAGALPVVATAGPPSPPQVQLTLKKPDLTISNVRALQMLPCTNGLPGVRFIVTVDNIGKLDLNPGPYNQALQVKGPSHSVKADLPFIAAGGSSKVMLEYTPQGTEDAKYPDTTFNFVVNPTKQIIESDYSNNTYSMKPAIPPPYCPNANPAPGAAGQQQH